MTISSELQSHHAPGSAGPAELPVVDALRRHVQKWYDVELGSAQGHASQIEFYSKGTERRFDLLLGPLKPLLFEKPPARILDVGCGLASIPTYLASIWPGSSVVATDVSDRFYRCGKGAAEDLGLDNIVFESRRADEIEAVDEFDLVMSCNMLNFMTSHAMVEDALSRIWRAAKQGGHVCVYTPHYWQLYEPFTKIPLLHILPVRTQDRIVRRLGKRSTLLDVRNPSVTEIRSVFAARGAKYLGARPALPRRMLSTHVAMWFQK